MAAMTVEFFKVKLIDQSCKTEVDHTHIKEIIDQIITRAVEHDEYKSIDISPNILPGDITPKEVIDFFEDENYLFGRICRKKSNNAILKRNYSTLQAEEVLTDAESRSRGIEVFTFFIFDYVKGILSIVNSKGAPKTSSIDALFYTYRPEFCLEFENIPNEEGVRVLYCSEHPEISKLDFEIPAPNAEFLQRILGLEEDVIRDLIQNDVMMASITLKPIPYGKLTRNKEIAKEILDILFRKRKTFSKTVVRGSSEKFGSRNFDLNAKMFTYPIDVKTYRTVEGRKVEYSLQEVVKQFQHGLHRAYEDNFDLLTAIADR